MASHTVSNSHFGDFSNVHNGNVYNNWPAGQAQNDSDNVYLRDLSITDPRLDKKRIIETKGPLLRDSYRWIFDHRDYQQWLDAQSGILWIKGDPGKGKTMLLCGIIKSLEEDEKVGNELAYFFCQASDARINAATAILGGLTFYLARRKRSLLSYVRERHPSPGKSLFDGPNGWVTICDIFEAVIQDSGWSRLVLVVDALDECVTDRDSFLRLVVRTSSKIKWLLSSRNMEDIQRRLLSKESVNPLSLELKENAESVSQAVHSYIDHCVTEMEIIKKNKELQSKVRDTLQSKADNTFLWAALAIKQLQGALKFEMLQILDQMPEGLQSLYQLMMNQIRDHPSQRRDLCIKLLSIVTTAYRPLHLGELSSVWQIEAECPQDQEDVRTVAQLCGSFLTVKDDTIYFIHQSAKDFVLQQSSQTGITSKHFYMFKSSLDAMSQKLHRNMYGLESPSTQIDEISTPCPDPLAYLRYQCTFWIDHLIAASEEEMAKDVQEYGSLYVFFTKVYLYWLEAISLLQAMDHTIGTLHRLSILASKKQDTPGLKALIEDAIRFFQSNRGIIETVPLQIYSSALVFAPECSIIRQEFIKNVRQGIPFVFNRPNSWGACVHTLTGHTDEIVSLAFSPTSRQLISSSMDGTARIWEIETGNCQQILLFGVYHCLVKISPDSKKVASSCSTDIFIWNTATGEKMHTLHGDGRKIRSMEFASDSRILVSASGDKTVWVWCTQTGTLLQTLRCHEEEERRSIIGASVLVAFSLDLRHVVVTCEYAAIVWNIETANKMSNFLEQEKEAFLAVAFSPDSELLASAHWPLYHNPNGRDSRINVWSVATGRKLKSCRFKCHTLFLKYLAFSSNTELVVPTTKGLCHWQFLSSLGFDDEISIPNVQNLLNIDFSFDMAFFAGSDDTSNTISVWQLESGVSSAGVLAKYIPSRDVHRVVMSPDSSVIASVSADTAVALWRTDTGQRCRMFTGHAVQVTGITFSDDSSIMVTSDMKGTLRIWQTATGECINELSLLESLKIFKNRQNSSLHIAISSDLKILACGSEDEIFVLKRSNDKEYECTARYATSEGNHTMRVEYLEASLNSVFASWIPNKVFKTSLKHEDKMEHWRIDTENPQIVDGVNQRGSFSYQKKNNGFVIPQHKNWRQKPATGEFAWITRKKERLIWIPTELRPRSARHWDSWGSILAIEVNYDTMLIIDFSRQPNTVACKDGEMKGYRSKKGVSSSGITKEKMLQEQGSV